MLQIMAIESKEISIEITMTALELELEMYDSGSRHEYDKKNESAFDEHVDTSFNKQKLYR